MLKTSQLEILNRLNRARIGGDEDRYSLSQRGKLLYVNGNEVPYSIETQIHREIYLMEQARDRAAA